MGVNMVSVEASRESLQALSNNNNNNIGESIRNNNGNNVRSSDSQPDYPVKTIEVKVCGPLYAELRDKKTSYRDVPEDGILVKIEYADTVHTYDASGNEITRESPTVLCLHGAPGSHRDFKHMIKHLQQTGHRVIVPNFPSKCSSSSHSLSLVSTRPRRGLLFPESLFLCWATKAFSSANSRDSLVIVHLFPRNSHSRSIQVDDKDRSLPPLGAGKEGIRQRLSHIHRRHKVSQLFFLPLILFASPLP